MRIFLIISLCTLQLVICAQKTKIMGKVVDAETGEALPFVNIAFRGTTVGTTSNFDGEFSLETALRVDTLSASFVGYVPQTRRVVRNSFQVVDFALQKDRISLAEVVVVAGENPAEVILRKAIERKRRNSSEDVDHYQYEAYTKIQFDANNVTEKFKNNGMLRPFAFIFDHIDTSIVNGKAYLPLFLTETLSEVYYRKSPRTRKEVITASKLAGVQNKSISQLMGDMYQSIDIYQNHIDIFDKNFVSPVANFALGFYKYYLVDSLLVDGHKCYNIMFKPRRRQELTFTGNIWIQDSCFAVKKYEMRIVDDANINFINDLVVTKTYDLFEGKHWMVTYDNVIVDFNVIDNNKKTVGFYGHKTTTYRHFVFQQPAADELYSYPVNIIVDEKCYDRTEQFWQESRHDSLARDERTIYEMVDSIKQVPIFNTYIDLIFMFTTGYYVWGNFELGPYYTAYSFNRVEGSRFRFGGRTSNKFSTRLMLEGYLAYGTHDEKFKYGGGFMYMLRKNPRRSFGAYYKYDVEQLGQSQNAFREDNIVASVFRRNPITKLSLVNEYKGYYEHEWFHGLMSKINFFQRTIYPFGSTSFEVNNVEGQPFAVRQFTTSELRLDTRIALKEKFVMGEFDRISLGTKYPICDVQFGYGFKSGLGGEFNYRRLQVGLKQWYNVGAFGWSKYIVELGKIWGTLPYPLLKLHEGNETYSFDEYSFNLMNYYEFVSDRYVSAYYTHHFDGLFLNKIPLMRKLKWREVTYVKGVVGDLSAGNRQYSKFPETLNTLSRPYYEAGVGVENILKVLRVDCIWRMAYLSHPNISKIGLRGTLQLQF